MALYDLPYPNEIPANIDIDSKAAETPEGLSLFIKTLSDDLCDKITNQTIDNGASKQNTNTELAKQIAIYLKGNSGNNQLSILSVAEQFGLSTSYVTRIFKEVQGKTILEYLTELRIQKARGLLAKTDMSIEALVVEVGYFDSSSFIRKFKRLTGITPGEYRKRAHLLENI
jgi:AraC-like DNA-binding protein